jgi:hypothetical protein
MRVFLIHPTQIKWSRTQAFPHPFGCGYLVSCVEVQKGEPECLLGAHVQFSLIYSLLIFPGHWLLDGNMGVATIIGSLGVLLLPGLVLPDGTPVVPRTVSMGSNQLQIESIQKRLHLNRRSNTAFTSFSSFPKHYSTRTICVELTLY